MKKLSLNKKALTLVVAVIAMLLVTTQVALALWYYVNAQYGGPPTIKINGNPADWQTFNVGDTISITGDQDAYAAICSGWGNEAWTEAKLDVSGPSGSDSDTTSSWNYSNYCAELWTITTLTIAPYPLTAPGTHTVYMWSYAEAASSYTGTDVDDFAEDLLTFEVIVPLIEVDIDIKPGSDPNCFNSDGHGVIPVAILGSADFDASTVDPSTVSLDGAEVRVKGKSGSAGSLQDVNGDGFQDLVVQILDDEIYSGDGTANLSGNLYADFGGTPIQGSDSICIRPPE